MMSVEMTKGCEFNPLPGTLFYLLEQEELFYTRQMAVFLDESL